jgi:hypothetical protein
VAADSPRVEPNRLNEAAAAIGGGRRRTPGSPSKPRVGGSNPSRRVLANGTVFLRTKKGPRRCGPLFIALLRVIATSVPGNQWEARCLALSLLSRVEVFSTSRRVSFSCLRFSSRRSTALSSPIAFAIRLNPS